MSEIVDYIKNHAEHHRALTFQEEYLARTVRFEDKPNGRPRRRLGGVGFRPTVARLTLRSATSSVDFRIVFHW